MKDLGVMLTITGAVLLLTGAALVFAGRFSRHLPGDIHLSGKNWSFSFPVMTCILVSIVLTIVLNVILRLFHR